MSEILTILPPVARRIHLPCRKCAVDRYHVVIAHTSSTTAKVQCEVCRSNKTYKLPSPPKAQVRSSSSRAAGTSGVAGKRSSSSSSSSRLGRGLGAAASGSMSLETRWLELQERLSTAGSSLLPYSPKFRFSVDQVIDHVKFGRGVVLQASTDRIEVLFQDGIKQMIHNRDQDRGSTSPL